MTGQGSSSTGGTSDLGRRVRARRLELGLSVSEVAERAGMDPGYLEYLEGSVASVTSGALLRLAAALETTTDVLAGGAIERPAGTGRAGRSPALEELSPEECVRLLSAGGVGRVVLATDGELAALPVNFRLLDGDLVFRTAEDGVIASAIAAGDAPVGFEVDHVDEALAEGWSVLIQGRARPVSGEEELARVEALGVEPWAGGERDLYVLVAPQTLTGRRIRVQR